MSFRTKTGFIIVSRPKFGLDLRRKLESTEHSLRLFLLYVNNNKHLTDLLCGLSQRQLSAGFVSLPLNKAKVLPDSIPHLTEPISKVQANQDVFALLLRKSRRSEQGNLTELNRLLIMTLICDTQVVYIMRCV